MLIADVRTARPPSGTGTGTGAPGLAVGYAVAGGRGPGQNRTTAETTAALNQAKL